ncbi:hypothetical protein ABPG74_021068 [Tetrahymena malaccensis]
MEVQKFYELIQTNKICSNLNRQIKCFGNEKDQIKQVTHILLAFINSDISLNECEIIRLGLIQFTNLTHFKMVFNILGTNNSEQVFIYVCEALNSLINIINLNLIIQSQINSEGATKLGQSLTYLKKIQDLNLVFEENVNISEKGSIDLAKGIRCLENLQHLSLKIKQFNKLGEGGFNAISQSIQSLNKLTQLEFKVCSDNNFEKSGQNQIDISLQSLTELNQLNLYVSSNREQIQNRDFIQKAKTLGYLSKLINLELHFDNYLNEEYFIHLGDSLSKLQNVRKIKIKLNKLAFADNECAIMLGKGLSKLEQLNLLSMSILTINIEEIQGLVYGLKQLYSLTELTLEFPKIVKNDYSTLNVWQGLSNLKALKEINLLLNLENSIQLALSLSQLNIRTANLSTFDEMKQSKQSYEKRLDLTYSYKSRGEYGLSVLILTKFLNGNSSEY